MKIIIEIGEKRWSYSVQSCDFEYYHLYNKEDRVFASLILANQMLCSDYVHHPYCMVLADSVHILYIEFRLIMQLINFALSYYYASPNITITARPFP